MFATIYYHTVRVGGVKADTNRRTVVQNYAFWCTQSTRVSPLDVLQHLQTSRNKGTLSRLDRRFRLEEKNRLALAIITKENTRRLSRND